MTGLFTAFDDALAGKEKQSQMVLGIRVSSAGGLEIPDCGLPVGIRDEFCGLSTEKIGVGQVEHCVRIAMGGRLFPPEHRHDFVFGQALAMVIKIAKTKLGKGVSVIGESFQYLGCLGISPCLQGTDRAIDGFCRCRNGKPLGSNCEKNPRHKRTHLRDWPAKITIHFYHLLISPEFPHSTPKYILSILRRFLLQDKEYSN